MIRKIQTLKMIKSPVNKSYTFNENIKNLKIVPQVTIKELQEKSCLMEHPLDEHPRQSYLEVVWPYHGSD